MDDSFKVRVDKVFGSLTPSSSSLWSLTDEEIEKREWNRERGSIDRENNPCSSSLDGFFSNQRKSNSTILIHNKLNIDLDEEKGPGQSLDPDDVDVRSSIGLDSTLDNEEEEDEIDKVALGKEKDAEERLYMKDINDYGPYLNSHNIIPESFDEHASSRERDIRANVYAAKIRLKEDEKEAFGAADKKVAVPLIDDGSSKTLKSILKRKENKSQKRVRFDPDAARNHNDMPEMEEDSVMLYNKSKSRETDGGGRGGVPDYLQNPSRYTRYSFDSGNEVDENTNQQAFMDFLNTIKRPESEVEAADLPSVTFIPKKKASVGITTMKDDMSNKKPSSQALGIAVATEMEENEACAMEEDDVLPVETKSRKGGRRYRSKTHPDD
ncbi:hypothetical protein ACHQM5_007741 [Ranunculus cassubicifolius]